MANSTLSNIGTATAPRRRSLSLPAWLVLIIAFTALLAAGCDLEECPPVPEIMRAPQQEVVLNKQKFKPDKKPIWLAAVSTLAASGDTEAICTRLDS